MQETWHQPQPENRLKENGLHNQVAHSFWEQRPVDFPLSARDLMDDAHRALIGEIERHNHYQGKDDFFDESEHVNSSNLSLHVRLFDIEEVYGRRGERVR